MAQYQPACDLARKTGCKSWGIAGTTPAEIGFVEDVELRRYRIRYLLKRKRRGYTRNKPSTATRGSQFTKRACGCPQNPILGDAGAEAETSFCQARFSSPHGMMIEIFSRKAIA